MRFASFALTAFFVALLVLVAPSCADAPAGGAGGGAGGGGGGGSGSGGGGGGGDGGTAATISRAQFLHDLAVAWCDAMFRCARGANRFAVERALFEDEAGCVEVLEGRPLDAGIEAALANGTTVIDAAAAAQCTTFLPNACDPRFAGTLDVACARVYRGTVPHGGACAVDAECANGGRCLGFPCPTCVAPTAGLGDACESTYDCFPSAAGIVECAYWSPSDVLRTCGLVPPIAEQALGEDCSFTRSEPWPSCAAGSYCDGTTCRANVAAGEPCDSLSGCEGLATCVPDEDGGVACERTTLATTVGAPCHPRGLRAPICDERQGLVCDPGNSTCVALGDGSVGSVCSHEAIGFAGCDPGLVCGGGGLTFGVCQARVPNGAECSRSEECESAYCSWGGTAGVKQCAAPGACEGLP